MTSIRRPLWRIFVPTTCGAKLRTFSYFAPFSLFGIATYAILQQQCHYRASIADESSETYDRIDRRVYIELPDGRRALVYPCIDTQMTLTRTVMSFLDAINPLP